MTPLDPADVSPPSYTGAAPGNEGDAMMIFGLGLVALLMCQLLGPAAWFRGHLHRSACRAAGVKPHALATVGWVLGIVSTFVAVAAVAFCGVMMRWK